MDGVNHVSDVSFCIYGLCLFTINFMMVFNAYMMHINAYYTLFLLDQWFMENNHMHMVKGINTLGLNIFLFQDLDS